MAAGAVVFWGCVGPREKRRDAPSPVVAPVEGPAGDAEVVFTQPRAPDSIAVLGLRWLTAHQEPSGLWHDPATTGIALLAYGACGETVASGSGREVVKRGVRALIDLQGADGGIAPRPGASPDLRTHAFAGLALVEHYGMTGKQALKGPARAAVKFAEATRRPGGGWGGAGDEPFDIEITARMAQVLQSGKLSELDVDAAALGEVAAAFERITDPATGRVTVPAGQRDRVSDDAATAMSLGVRQYAGRDTSVDPLAATSSAALAAKPPNAATTDLPYALFGVYAMFRVEDGWRPWSQGFTALATSPPDQTGSWALAPNASARDRVWTTAYHVLAASCFYGPVGHSRRKR